MGLKIKLADGNSSGDEPTLSAPETESTETKNNLKEIKNIISPEKENQQRNSYKPDDGTSHVVKIVEKLNNEGTFKMPGITAGGITISNPDALKTGGISSKVGGDYDMKTAANLQDVKSRHEAANFDQFDDAQTAKLSQASTYVDKIIGLLVQASLNESKPHQVGVDLDKLKDLIGGILRPDFKSAKDKANLLRLFCLLDECLLYSQTDADFNELKNVLPILLAKVSESSQADANLEKLKDLLDGLSLQKSTSLYSGDDLNLMDDLPASVLLKKLKCSRDGANLMFSDEMRAYKNYIYKKPRFEKPLYLPPERMLPQFRGDYVGTGPQSNYSEIRRKITPKSMAIILKPGFCKDKNSLMDHYGYDPYSDTFGNKTKEFSTSGPNIESGRHSEKHQEDPVQVSVEDATLQPETDAKPSDEGPKIVEETHARAGTGTCL